MKPVFLALGALVVLSACNDPSDDAPSLYANCVSVLSDPELSAELIEASTTADAACTCLEARIAGEDETEILNITVGQPTFLSTLQYQNSASVAVSRTGTVAAFYPKLDIGGMFYRTSTDAGRTWGKERTYPWYVGPMSVGLREGGVLNVWDVQLKAG